MAHDIRSVRAKLGVTQIELAQMLGLDQSTISRFENGKLAVDARTQLALEALTARAKPVAQAHAA